MMVRRDDLAEQILGEIEFLMTWEQATVIAEVALRFTAAKLQEEADAWWDAAYRPQAAASHYTIDTLMAVHARTLAGVFDPDLPQNQTPPVPT
jgi:hypothetical protein